MVDTAKLIEQPEWLDKSTFPFQSHSINVQGHDLHFIDEGTGPVLLMLHGNCSWSFGFRKAIPLLSPSFRVVAVDYPGFGLSVAPKDFSFLPEDHSKVIEAFVDALGLKDICLFVEDWGGPIGLGFAGRRPELITSIAIANTWAWPAQGSRQLEGFSKVAGSWLGRFLITRFNVFGWLFVPNFMVAVSMTAAERLAYWMPYPTPESRMPQAIFPVQILASREYLAEVEHGLDRLKDKTAGVIWGESDGAFGEVERNRLLGHFPNANVVLLPKARHFVCVDEPELVAEAIVNLHKDKVKGSGS